MGSERGKTSAESETVVMDDPYYLIALSAHAAYLNSLVGNPAPEVKDFYEWLSKPEPGDLVLEHGSVYRWTPAALGILVRHSHDPLFTEEEWTAAVDGEESPAKEWTGRADASYSECPTDEFWYVEPLDPSYEFPAENAHLPEHPRAVRWENCSFIRVVAKREQLP